MVARTENDNIEQEEDILSNGDVYLRYRFGEAELEAKGPRDYVEDHAEAFLRMAAQRQMIIEGETNKKDTPLLPDNDVSEKGETKAVSPEKPSLDLISFYRKKDPKSQSDQVLAITSYYQKHLGQDALTLDDYEAAYTQLKRLAVPMPRNMKSSVRNVVDRTDYLYNPERGVFALTLLGEEYVDHMDT